MAKVPLRGEKNMSQERTREEEIEYQRYLHRLKRREQRRRKVMIARAIVAVAGILLVVLFAGLIRLGFRAVTGHKSSSENKQAQASASPTLEPLDYSVPEGMEEYAEQLEAMREDYPEVEDILLNLYEYSESMLNLAINNQETLDFVLAYPQHKSDQKASGEVTSQELAEATNGIPLFQQWDTRWGYLSYGNDNLAVNGCGPTCLSMVVSGLLKDTSQSPAAVAEFSVENNYCTAASGSSWSLMSSGAKKLGLEAESVTVSAESITKALENNQPVICSMKPGDFTTTGHFIVLTGLTEEGKLDVNDPNSIARSEEKWDVDTVISQVKAAWTYSVSS
jgi:hypothetical protein